MAFEDKADVITRKDVIEEVSKLKDSVDRWRVKMETQMDSHHIALFGNGKPGLDEEVRNINRSLATLTKLSWIVVGSLVPLIISGTAFAVVYLIQTIQTP